MKKHTTRQWGIARHIATRMQSMGKAAPALFPALDVCCWRESGA